MNYSPNRLLLFGVFLAVNANLNLSKSLAFLLHGFYVSCFKYSESESVSHSVVSNFAALRTVALQAPLSMGFSRQEYWSGLLSLPAGDLSDPGIKPLSPALQADHHLSHRIESNKVTRLISGGMCRILHLYVLFLLKPLSSRRMQCGKLAYKTICVCLISAQSVSNLKNPK